MTLPVSSSTDFRLKYPIALKDTLAFKTSKIIVNFTPGHGNEPAPKKTAVATAKKFHTHHSIKVVHQNHLAIESFALSDSVNSNGLNEVRSALIISLGYIPNLNGHGLKINSHTLNLNREIGYSKSSNPRSIY